MREPRKEAWTNSGYSRKIAQRHWNLPEKGEMESQREETFIDDIVQKSRHVAEIAEHKIAQHQRSPGQEEGQACLGVSAAKVDLFPHLYAP